MVSFPRTTELIVYICIILLYVQSIRLSKLSLYKNDLIAFVIILLSYIIMGCGVLFMFVFIDEPTIFYGLILVYIIGIFVRLFGKFIYVRKVNDQKTYQDIIKTLKDLARFIGLTIMIVILLGIIFDLIYWFTFIK